VPEKETLARARRDAKAGKAPSTQAGEFVREEIEHIRARPAGASGHSSGLLPVPEAGRTSARTRQQAARDARQGRSAQTAPSQKRSAATLRALKKEPRSAASHRALARQAKSAARTRRRSTGGSK